VVHLLDSAGKAHLGLVTSDRFGDISFLELFTGTTVSLNPAGLGMDMLPLAQQGRAVLHHVLDQLLSRHRSVVVSGEDDTIVREQISSLLTQLASHPSNR
jgi:hypothetical protein